MAPFIEALEQTIKVLGRFASPPGQNSLRWNGVAYVSTAQQAPFDQGAAIWCSTLEAIAALLASQDCRISQRQRHYLDRALFGGMGSLNDFQIDERLGAAAKKANVELNHLRERLFHAFQRL